LLPADARVAGVYVRQERRVAWTLYHRDMDVMAGRPVFARRRCLLLLKAGEELGELASDHRAGVSSRQVRAIGSADTLVE